MELVNQIVEHIKFGPGVIAEINDDKIVVHFKDKIGTKIFIYPDAFDKFLKAVNPTAQNNVMEEWRRKEEQIRIEHERKVKEREAAELEAKKEKQQLLKEKAAARSRAKKKKQQ